MQPEHIRTFLATFKPLPLVILFKKLTFKVKQTLLHFLKKLLTVSVCLPYAENSEGSGFGSISDPLSFSGLKTKRRQTVQILSHSPDLKDRQRQVPL